MNTTMIKQHVFTTFQGWTRFEKIWLSLFTIINLALLIIWRSDPISFISSMAGMFCVVLVAKGKITNYFFGLTQVLLYGFVALNYQLYGEVVLNWVFYVPVQFVGFYLWMKHTDKTSNSDVAVKRLTGMQFATLLVIVIVLIAGFAFILHSVGGASIGLDSATTILSIVAQFMMLARYAEQWLMWIIINILSIIMWGQSIIGQDGNDYPTLVMWIAFLCNSIYGYINWRKLYVQQTDNQ